MRFEQDTACRGTHCASTPQPSALQQRSRLEEVVEEEVDSSAKDIDGQRRRRELEANVVEGANTGPRAEAGGPGMAYPASATALNQHSAFATSIAGTPSSNPNGHISGGHLPAPAAPRPTDFSVSSYFSAAALAAAGFYNPAAHLPATSSPGLTAHHLQGKGILSSAHHHPHLNPHGITPPGKGRCVDRVLENPHGRTHPVSIWNSGGDVEWTPTCPAVEQDSSATISELARRTCLSPGETVSSLLLLRCDDSVFDRFVNRVLTWQTVTFARRGRQVSMARGFVLSAVPEFAGSSEAPAVVPELGNRPKNNTIKPGTWMEAEKPWPRWLPVDRTLEIAREVHPEPISSQKTMAFRVFSPDIGHLQAKQDQSSSSISDIME
ncbi:hypothetical protein WN48_00992 [Eufriesea mexicana]|uniref:Uncharacterized protein n=1 Tax=Eufriesea mexicana TaxID=516756 RepID=A0A310SRP7_9HYME|nr:hypothetical protein WN48_00992 [Eufriesea mexicana]